MASISVANGECMFSYDRIGKNLVAFAIDLVTMYSPGPFGPLVLIICRPSPNYVTIGSRDGLISTPALASYVGQLLAHFDHEVEICLFTGILFDTFMNLLTCSGNRWYF